MWTGQTCEDKGRQAAGGARGDAAGGYVGICQRTCTPMPENAPRLLTRGLRTTVRAGKVAEGAEHTCSHSTVTAQSQHAREGASMHARCPALVRQTPIVSLPSSHSTKDGLNMN